ncbi:MAG: ABC transporter permease [Gemmiger sp.]|uniref:ABC transporter permease n=1 Tax=Gemmiger sp. TaxID=2049027 RepID=UPI002E75B007|nr:ABC transporter permease [Gemmiger sp.]MEE0800580.1 ABC transporter permease [Gemmiger sp.]
MKISDQIGLSAKNLTRRMGRTALTVVGVVVGTCLIVVMISLGIAQNQANEEMLASWGDLTQIQVYGGGIATTTADGKQVKLDDDGLEQIRALDHVLTVTPFYQAYNLNGRISAGQNDRYQITGLYQMVGLFPDALEPMGFQLVSGSWLSDSDSYGKDVLPVLVCQNTGYSFEDTRKSMNSPKRYRWSGMTDAAGNPVKPFVDVNKDDMTLTLSASTDSGDEKTQTWKLKVVGTLQSDYSKGWWTDSGIVIRLKDMKMLTKAYAALSKNSSLTQSATYDQVYVKVDDLENVEEVENAIHDIGFTSTYSSTQERDNMKKQVARSQMILGGLAAMSLFVSALNIMNTMTMAIYERTREIGIMKVLGCELGNIRRMFLMESGFIGFIGGVIGDLISLVVGFVLNNISLILSLFGQNVDLSSLTGSYAYAMGGSSKISIIPPWLLLGALLFATLIGLLSGVAPAGKAVRISALEAIRHD